MEDIKSIKLNKEAADLPEVPRKEDGAIDLEAISTGKTEKGFYIVPDEIFNAYYNDLPAGTVNQSKTWRAAEHGKLKILGGDPENDRQIWKAGADTLNATKAQRRTFAEVIEDMLVKKANEGTIEDLELTTDVSNLTAITAAAIKQASRGNVKAMEFLRDTIGQKPSEKIDANVTALTPEDKEMLQRVQARLDSIQ